MKVDIENEFVDHLVRHRLKLDYQYLLQDIKKLEEMEKREPYQEQDLKDTLMYKGSMEHMLEYYVGFNWRNEMNNLDA
ncbi:MAG: hypothetical protein ACOVLB_07845 [Candidatus Nanopelagicus sp.]